MYSSVRPHPAPRTPHTSHGTRTYRVRELRNPRFSVSESERLAGAVCRPRNSISHGDTKTRNALGLALLRPRPLRYHGGTWHLAPARVRRPLALQHLPANPCRHAPLQHAHGCPATRGQVTTTTIRVPAAASRVARRTAPAQARRLPGARALNARLGRAYPWPYPYRGIAPRGWVATRDGRHQTRGMGHVAGVGVAHITEVRCRGRISSRRSMGGWLGQEGKGSRGQDGKREKA